MSESRIVHIRKKLMGIDVNEHTESKGGFTYLSWAWAVAKMLELCPDVTWQYIKDAEGNISHQDRTGYFVETAVTIDGITIHETMPVLDYRNQPIKSPNSFHINTSQKRCLTKNFAMFGLGLYIYAGEDTAYFLEGEDEEVKPSKTKRSGVQNPFAKTEPADGKVSAKAIIEVMNIYKGVRKEITDGVENVRKMNEIVKRFPTIKELIGILNISAEKPSDLKPDERVLVNDKLEKIIANKDALLKEAEEAESETPDADARPSEAETGEGDIYDN